MRRRHGRRPLDPDASFDSEQPPQKRTGLTRTDEAGVGNGRRQSLTKGLIMTHVKLLAAAHAIAPLGLTSRAPAAPIAADTVAGASHVTHIAYGCGPGFVPGRFGYGRPFFRRYGYYG